MDLLKEAGVGGAVQNTQLSHKLSLGGQAHPYPVYNVRLDKLMYNPQNDRIATWMSQYKAEHGGVAPDHDDVAAYNDIIEDFIVKSNEAAIKRTANNIRALGQRVPAVVLSNGLIVDGNRRFTCLRRLAREEDRFNWIEAVILPEGYASDQKTIKLLELEIQHGEEEKVDYDPIERLVGVYNDIVHNQLLTEEEYAKGTNSSVKEVHKMVVQAGLMIDFLEFINAPEQFHIARQMSLGGPLVELPAILRSCTDEDVEEQVKNCVFANIVVEPAGDITRFIRKFKKILTSPSAPAFIEQEVELAANLSDRIDDIETMSVSAIRDEIRADQALVSSFASTMEMAEAKAKGDKVLATPLDNMESAAELLNDVDDAILKHVKAPDLKRAVRALKDIETRIGELREIVDGVLNEYED